MTSSALLSSSERVLRALIRRLKSAARAIRPRKKRVLFAYGGRTSHWPGMGRTLYEHEPVFRASVQETCRLIEELSGQAILPNFEGPLDPDFFATGTKTMFSIVTLQVALTDLWKAKGITPDAAMGVSLGEVAAVYAAGGLSRLDVVRVCAAWLAASMNEPHAYITIYLSAGLEEAQVLCRRCRVMLTVVYQVGPESVVAFGPATERTVITTFLDENGLQWSIPDLEKIRPFHTPAYIQYHDLMRTHLRDIRPQPLEFTYYSATTGQAIPKDSLVPAWLWNDLLSSPVLLHTLLQQIASDDFHFVTHIGPHPFLTGNTQKKSFDALSNYTIVDSMRQHTPERQLFQQTYRMLRRAAWPDSLFTRTTRPIDANAYHRFLQGLHLSAPEVVMSAPDVYAYLRTGGPIHYLPLHQGWLVSDYAEVNHVLQHPELFSSQINQGFDAFLVGVDPPDHTVVRSLMVPLLAPSALSNLSDFMQTELNNRLRELGQRDQFDVADELILPFVQTVMAHFLGLSAQADQDLRASLNGHLYGLTYLNNLKVFFQSYLEQPLPGRTGQLLLDYVQAGKLSVEGAVGLMRTVWIAGTLTTSILLMNLINSLVRQPQLTRQLRQNLDLIPKFVEEGLRLEPSETTLWRTTTLATTLAGQHLPAGSLIMLSLLGANRDPLVFTNPDEYDLDRPGRRSMAFGGGVHHCIGAGIARSQAQLVVQTILARWPNLRLFQPGPPQYYTPTSQRALINLLVTAL